MYAGRIDADAAARGELASTTWWNGEDFGAAALAHPVVRDLQTEFTVHRGSDGQFWMISTEGFGDADVVLRRAERPEGPWSSPSVLHHPVESREKGVFVYSAKAHPALRFDDSASSPLWITYCTNHEDFFTQAARQDLYFPRFLRFSTMPTR